MNDTPTLTDIVKDNNPVRFSMYRDGYLHYEVKVAGTWYMFRVPISDTGSGSFYGRMKAVTLMRWIRKALEAGEFIRVGAVVPEPEDGG